MFLLILLKFFYNFLKNCQTEKLLKNSKETPAFPENLETDLLSELKKIKTTLTEKKQKGLIYSRYIENLLREIFCFTMSDLLSGYSQYLTFMDDVPLFNSESFIANKHKNYKNFFADFCSTQVFRQFLQNDSKENFPYFYKIEKQNKNAINHNSRQSCFTPRTSVLDISKFTHLRSNSINIQTEGISFNVKDTQNLIGIRFCDNNTEKNKEKKKDKEKNKSNTY